MTINAPLLRKVLAHIEALPADAVKGWDQRTYRCETGMCFAGWTAELTGAVWAPMHVYPSGVYAVAEDGENDLSDVSPYGEFVWVADRAARLLGLTYRQADLLFSSRNTLQDLRDIIDDLCAQAMDERLTHDIAAFHREVSNLDVDRLLAEALDTLGLPHEAESHAEHVETTTQPQGPHHPLNVTEREAQRFTCP